MAKGEKDFGKPRDDAKAEEKSKPLVYAGKGSNTEKEAEERKHGGKAKRKRGGQVSKHHERGEHMKHAKHLGQVHGELNVHKGREPRKSGGRTGSNFNPLSSAHSGTDPRGHKTVDID